MKPTRLVKIKRGEWKVELLRKYTKGVCLDLGSFNRLYESDFRGEYVALDIELREKPPDILADASHLPFRSEAFDTVVAFDLLEHIKHPDLLVNEIYYVLKPGGVFLATTPNAFSLGSWIDFTHTWHFTRERIVRLLCGVFKDVDVFGTGYPSLKIRALQNLADRVGYVDSFIIVARKETN